MQQKIFIVDDDEITRELFKMIFEKAGYAVTGFRTGKELINHEILPDIFLVDRHLVYMDGLDVCRILKADKAKSNIPVIILSANPDVKNLYENAGADDFIQKPFHLGELVARVSAHII